MGEIIKATRKPSLLQRAEDMITGGGSTSLAMAYGVMAAAKALADIAKTFREAVHGPDYREATPAVIANDLKDIVTEYMHVPNGWEMMAHQLLGSYEMRPSAEITGGYGK